jgi:hypothetical protein
MPRLITIVAMALFLTVAGCSGDQATQNRDALGTSQTVLAAAQTGALAYRNRPACPSRALVCRDAAIYAEIQRIDRIATEANNAAYAALKRDPSAPSTKFFISTAVNAINGFSAFTKEAK